MPTAPTSGSRRAQKSQVFIDTMVFSDEGLRHLVAEMGVEPGRLRDRRAVQLAGTVDLVLNAKFLSDADKSRSSAETSRSCCGSRNTAAPYCKMHMRTILLPVVQVTILCAAAIAALPIGSTAAIAQTPSRVIRLIDQRCAGCHINPGSSAYTPRRRRAASGGSSKDDGGDDLSGHYTRVDGSLHVQDIPDDVKRAMAE